MKPLPVSFVERIKKQYPNDHSVFVESLERPVITSVHLHSEKGKELSIKYGKELLNINIKYID
jgi:hypothetical protein